MNIVIAGGTGFIGQQLTSYLVTKGHSVYILTRQPDSFRPKEGVTYIGWLSTSCYPEKELPHTDVFINLAGESINSGRWTAARKQRILESRLKATEAIIQLISKMKHKPNTLINASAIGFYGTSVSKTFTEKEGDHGKDFLADLTAQWEERARKAEGLGVRVVLARLGVVLAKQDGALPRMVLPYKLFIGGKIGSGKQWLSWIHIEDVVQLIEFAFTNESIRGPLNITAPQPMQMNLFGKSIGKVLGRPHLIPAPEFALKLVLGEMSTLVLEGQKVIPEKALNNGYSFKFNQLEEALRDIFT